MFQVETMPQSIVDMKILVLKPRLDQGDIELIGVKIKPRLFSNFGFKPKSEDIKLLGSEIYFEPYFIIGGKYVLDYCRKHVFKVNVTEKTTKVFIAGQEFKSEQSDPKKTNKTITMTGQESAHHERQAYFILDRMKREIPPEKLPISPFDFQNENFDRDCTFKSIHIPENYQIEFLKTKIAVRPSDVAEIMKEVFEITDRTIVYYPMYHLTFENKKNQTEAIVTINGVTGEIVMNGAKKLANKIIVAFPENNENQPAETALYTNQKNTVSIARSTSGTVDASPPPEKEETAKSPLSDAGDTIALGFPARISGDVFVVGDNVTAVVGDLEVPSGTTINKILVVKGNLRIGDNCLARGKLKVLKDVTIGADTFIDGDLIAGGNVFIGTRSHISGSLEAAGYIKVCENATIERGLHPNRSLAPEISEIQFGVDIENTIA